MDVVIVRMVSVIAEMPIVVLIVVVFFIKPFLHAIARLRKQKYQVAR